MSSDWFRPEHAARIDPRTSSKARWPPRVAPPGELVSRRLPLSPISGIPLTVAFRLLQRPRDAKADTVRPASGWIGVARVGVEEFATVPP